VRDASARTTSTVKVQSRVGAELEEAALKQKLLLEAKARKARELCNR